MKAILIQIRQNIAGASPPEMYAYPSSDNMMGYPQYCRTDSATLQNCREETSEYCSVRRLIPIHPPTSLPTALVAHAQLTRSVRCLTPPLTGHGLFRGCASSRRRIPRRNVLGYKRPMCLSQQYARAAGVSTFANYSRACLPPTTSTAASLALRGRGVRAAGDRSVRRIRGEHPRVRRGPRRLWHRLV